jgi:hypothetical protein
MFYVQIVANYLYGRAVNYHPPDEQFTELCLMLQNLTKILMRLG